VFTAAGLQGRECCRTGAAVAKTGHYTIRL
jgi:hypothetical protein